MNAKKLIIEWNHLPNARNCEHLPYKGFIATTFFSVDVFLKGWREAVFLKVEVERPF